MSLTFTEIGVPADLTRRLDKLGLTQPFAIQTATVAPALEGRDVAGKAPTGSGKTLAFSLPLAVLAKKASPRRPTALVLAPTRELASQIKDTLAPLAEVRGRSVATVFGGTDIRRDVKRLRNGVDIVVACPGRLADLVRRGDVHLGDVRMVVLDEADRMADMGFLPEVRRLLDATHPERQTLLFSATLDGDVEKLVRRYQRDPFRHEVHTPEEERGDVRHLFWPAERPARRGVVTDVLRTMSPAIVFTRTKRGADRLARQLAQAGISTAAIHGDRTQKQRERALANFSDGSVTTLVATDVAARGIHVDQVAVVVHFDLPADPKDYVHRSGRTGRAGADGVVVSFAGPDETDDLDQLQRTLNLPRGMHPIDLELLASDDVPAPIATASSRRRDQARPSGQGKARSGSRKRSGRSGSHSSGGNAGRSSGGGSRSSGTGNSGGGTPRGGARHRSKRNAAA